MRLSLLSLLIAIAVALSLVQGCATEPKAAAVNVLVLVGGKRQALDKTFPCGDAVGVLTEAGVAKAATIQVQFVPGGTIREVVTLMNTLNAAGFTGVSKTAGSSAPNDS